MNAIKFTFMLILTTALALSAAGCKKADSEHAGHDHSSKPAEITETASAKVTEQTKCPVMEGAINKELFIEHEGKKVYFCCAGCEDIFKKNPEKYISKLPQFQEK